MKETGIANLGILLASIGGLAWVSDDPEMTTQPVVIEAPDEPGARVVVVDDDGNDLGASIAKLTADVADLKKSFNPCADAPIMTAADLREHIKYLEGNMTPAEEAAMARKSLERMGSKVEVAESVPAGVYENDPVDTESVVVEKSLYDELVAASKSRDAILDRIDGMSQKISDHLDKSKREGFVNGRLVNPPQTMQTVRETVNEKPYTGIVISVYDPKGCWTGNSEHPCKPCIGLINDVLKYGNNWTIGLTSKSHFWIRKSPESQHGQPMLLVYEDGKVTKEIRGYSGLLKEVLKQHPRWNPDNIFRGKET